jgi:tetratricopeptide (TPR) repeat protein
MFGKKNKLVIVKPLCIVLLLLSLLVSCSSTIGPVVIRDSTNVDITSIDRASVNNRVNTNVSTTSGERIALIDPVAPDAKKLTVPIIERLVEQADQQYRANNYKKAINIAEKGLRIDRKEPRFYLTLTKSYKRLNNNKQAVFFARQGLRYAQKSSPIFLELKRMSAG